MIKLFRNIIKHLSWLALILGGAGSAGAETFKATIYECKVVSHEPYDIFGQMVFAHDAATDAVLVHSGLIYAFNDGQPMAGQVRAENAARITFSWSIHDMAIDPLTFIHELSFRATYLKKRNRLTVIASFGGSDEQLSGTGKCSIKEELIRR